MQKSIMFITNNGNGLYNFRYEIISELRKKRYIIYLVYPNGDRKKEFEKIGCICLNVTFDSSSTNPFVDIKLFNELKKLILDYKPDCALLYTIKPCIYGGIILKRLEIPYISTVTGISPALISEKNYVRWISTFLSRKGYKGASIVFFQNKMNEEMFKRLKIVPNETLLVAGSGVNLDKFTLQDYPVNDGWIKLLFIGRLKRIKGIEELSYAVKKAINEGLKVKCKIVGELGDNLPVFRKSLREGYLEYEGPTNNVIPYIVWCDAIVQPSYGEGMSNVLQEASACGRPILASNIPGCKELFDEGISGLGFTSKDGESLYKTIKEFCAIPYEKRKIMGLKAREKMEKEFDRRNIVAMYVSKVDQLLGE